MGIQIDFNFHDENGEHRCERFVVTDTDGEETFKSIKDCKDFFNYIHLSYAFEETKGVVIHPFYDKMISLKDKNTRLNIVHKKISYDEIREELNKNSGLKMFFNLQKSLLTYTHIEDYDYDYISHREIVNIFF